MPKKTIEEYFKTMRKEEVPKANLLSWNQFNRKAENIWDRGGWVKFIGESRTDDGTMFVGFKDDKSHIYCVSNDVVFKFQEKQKSVIKLI